VTSSRFEIPPFVNEVMLLNAYLDRARPIPEIAQFASASLLRAHGFLPREQGSVAGCFREIGIAIWEDICGPSDGDRVYFVQASSDGLIKIGHSTSVASRLAVLQASSPVKLRLLLDVPGGAPLEMFLHEAFAVWRQHGEWFSPCPALLTLIAQFAQETR